MKLQTQIIAGAAALAFLTGGVAGLQAAETVTNPLTITATVRSQGGTNIVHGVTIVTNQIQTLTTKTILGFLARDEFAAGRYSATNFPAGAKLVAIVSTGGDDYQVLDKKNQLLVDVSNIITFSTTSEVYVGRTKSFPVVGVAGDPTEVRWQAATFSYDDSAITGSVGFHYTMVGTMKRTVTYTFPSYTTLFVATSATMAFSGTGSYQGTPFIVTGTLNAAGARLF